MTVLVLVGGLVAPARGDGDPASDILASDTLPFHDVFLPYEPVSPALAQKLRDTVAAANNSGFRIKVALLASPTDLGAVPVLFNMPEQYAKFLGAELLGLYKERLLVVMPAGFRNIADVVVGVDLSHESVAAARDRYPELEAHVGEIRALPFPDASFDAVVSNSTLDHFASFDDLVAGAREIARVLAPGGQLLITLDNPWNPLVALRNALPFGLLRRLGLVPYFVGTTCGPTRLASVLSDAGFSIVELSAVMHFRRLVARLIVARLAGIGGSASRRSSAVRALGSFESLRRLPTRYLTGHFVVALAVRKADSVEELPLDG